MPSRATARATRRSRSTMQNGPHVQQSTKSQVESAQGTRSLERAVAGLRATLHASIQAIPREVWESMLAGDPESYDYYRAVEQTPPPGFRLAAISVSEAGRILAVAPIFYVNYRLDTPLQGGLRRATAWVNERLPQLVRCHRDGSHYLCHQTARRRLSGTALALFPVPLVDHDRGRQAVPLAMRL